MTHRIAALAIALAAAPGSALAGGFILNDHGAKATGRMDAVTATVTDGSAIFYNPGGVGAATGTHFYFGATVIMPDASFTDERTGITTDSQTDPAITPNAYVHAEANEMIRVGLGFFTPYGSTVEWPEDAAFTDVLRSVTLRTFFISPVVGIKLDRWVPGLAIGGGIDFVPATIELERDIFFGDQVGEAHLGGTGFGAGGRLGVQYRPEPVPGLSLGVAWRSKVAIDFDGEGDFDAPAPFRSALPPDGDIESRITLPQSVLAGVAYTVGNFEVEGNLQWVDWSEVETIEIELPDGSVSTDRRDYEDAFTPRLGLEYRFPGPGVAVRGGYAYDPTPIPDTRLSVNLPDIDRHVVSLGGSVRLPRGYIDAGLLAVLPGENETSDAPNEPQLKGSFEVSALVMALSYGVTLGGEDATGQGRLTTARR